ncbi:MAG: glycosyltransferase family 2 protein [Nitrospirae bacterium YQR-1]
MKTISIVIPVYCEEENIKKFYDRIAAIKTPESCEIIEYVFVDDGSTDSTFIVLKHLATLDGRLKVIRLSRNFGKETALTAGVKAAKGDAVITMDGDLQHPPELISDMVQMWRAGKDVVIAVRETSTHSSFIRMCGARIFYWIMNKISAIDMEANSTDFRLIDKKVAEAFSTMTEQARLYRGLINWLGFEKGFIRFEADKRHGGSVMYSYRKLIELALNSFTSFSLFPLKIAGILGILISVFSAVLTVIIFVSRFLYKSQYFSPLSIVVVSNTFLIGVVLICMGLIGIYTGNIYKEVQNRPLFIVKETINMD